jgi:hypothetical protein
MPNAPSPRAPSAFRRFAIVAGTGALVGFVLFCVFGPRVIGWWYTPPAKEAFSCGASVADALSEFVKLQLGAAVLGAILVLCMVAFARWLWAKVTRKGAPEPALAAPAPATPAAPEPGPASGSGSNEPG